VYKLQLLLQQHTSVQPQLCRLFVCSSKDLHPCTRRGLLASAPDAAHTQPSS